MCKQQGQQLCMFLSVARLLINPISCASHTHQASHPLICPAGLQTWKNKVTSHTALPITRRHGAFPIGRVWSDRSVITFLKECLSHIPETLAELYLCWKIFNDFNQVLAVLSKGFIYRVSFQASLEDRTNQKNQEHIHLAAFADILAQVKREIQMLGRTQTHTTGLILQHLIHQVMYVSVA